jgi:hypothetical protein
MSRAYVSERRLLVGVITLITLGVSGLLSGAVSRAPAASVTATHATAAPVIARAARLLSIDDTGHLHLLHASGEVLDEEGTVSGTLPGSVKVRMTIGANVTASFTIAAHGGSIEGHGSAALHSSGRYSSFGGTLSVSHGTGTYAHAHGGGGLYGVINRRTDALTVQTTGDLHY